MGSFDATGFIAGERRVVNPSTAVTGAGTGTAVTPTEEFQTARLTVDVTAVGGTTPSLVVTLQTSRDKTTWSDVGSFPAATGVGQVHKSFSGLDRYCRVTWTLGGTAPTATFSVSGSFL